ncbi:ParB/RepB/Spo0J family partition protein [Geminicoccaceae bacterium 1502E]|nr:ParB/RepB/Spo0J family partition protein [Geminicoccaceae bacterium 1502E]
MMRQTDKRAALSRSVLDLAGAAAPATPAPPVEKPSAAGRGIVGQALDVHKQGLLERVAELEAARSSEEASGVRLVELNPGQVRERLPADRDGRALRDPAFEELKASIRDKGQDTPIVVRRAGPGYELAAGRRRLAACRELELPVLARVMDLDDDAMLALQYRENAERADISVWERGRWFARLASEQGRSTTQLARLFGISQPSIVEYLKLGRLPEPLIGRLADPRELSLSDGRRLHAAASGDAAALERMVVALDDAEGLTTREQLARALAAAAGKGRAAPVPRSALRGRVVVDARGRKLLTITRSGNQWIYRWAPEVDEATVSAMADRLAALLGEDGGLSEH